MTRIRWRDVPEPDVEQMVAVLLSHQHQGAAARIDGRGGDGGRDVQITTPSGIRAFEIKSFTGRMTSSRRAKVQASLERAATLAPIDWTLLVPIDPNPAELEWFGRLGMGVSFPITWRGLTWLDAEFAERPFISRYYLEGASDELRVLTTLFNQERAALAGGAVDVLERMRDLVLRANDLDPHYRFSVASDGTTSSIQVIPRYPGAERDRPITVSLTLSFPKDGAGRRAELDFRRALDFGTGFKVPEPYLRETTFDAPANLGSLFHKGAVELRPSRPSETPVEVAFAVLDPTGRSLGEVPLSLRAKSRGARGAIFTGTDRSGVMAVELTLDAIDGSLGVEVRARAISYYPAELRPAVAVLANMVKPNALEIRHADGERFGRVDLEREEPLVSTGLPDMVDDLSLVQWASRMTRKVSPSLGHDDIQALTFASELLRRGPVDVGWDELTIVLRADAAEEVRRSLLGEGLTFELSASEPHMATIDGVCYPIGSGTWMEIQSAVLEPGHDDWREAGVIPAGATVRLVPGKTRAAKTMLLND